MPVGIDYAKREQETKLNLIYGDWVLLLFDEYIELKAFSPGFSYNEE